MWGSGACGGREPVGRGDCGRHPQPLRGRLRPGRSIVVQSTAVVCTRFTPHLRVALPFGQVSTGHTLPSGAIATDAKSPCPFPGRRKGARPNPIYNESISNGRVTLIATAVPGMGYKGILPKRACRLVFAYFLPKQKVGNPRSSLVGEECHYTHTKKSS